MNCRISNTMTPYKYTKHYLQYAGICIRLESDSLIPGTLHSPNSVNIPGTLHSLNSGNISGTLHNLNRGNRLIT